MGDVTSLKTTATALYGRFAARWDAEPFVARVAAGTELEVHVGASQLTRQAPATSTIEQVGTESITTFNTLRLPCSWPLELAYLETGDIVRVTPSSGEVWVMYRRSSRYNAVFLTEQCNSWCLMCSQPPKTVNDEPFAQAWLDAIPLMSQETQALGITGGEPTLLSNAFLEIVRCCERHLPRTSVHVLSNGRLFNYLSLAQELSSIGHHDLMIGIPLYSDLAWQHDFVVQAQQAFDQTVRGILNLARYRVPIEIRVVLHRYSVGRLATLARFIADNFPFVSHVALMGLEPIGFAKANLQSLWSDPADYSDELSKAVGILSSSGLAVSIYNHQLCTLPRDLWDFARQSISDWKNVFVSECATCSIREQCCGFFHSAPKTIQSRAIAPISTL